MKQKKIIKCNLSFINKDKEKIYEYEVKYNIITGIKISYGLYNITAKRIIGIDSKHGKDVEEYFKKKFKL